MNIKAFNQRVKRYGIAGFIQKGFQYLLGIHKQQEEIDTLYYFINEYIDASSFPPTKDPDARIMQLCDAALLAIFDKICGKYNLQYWLDWGTLLGAVRHKGFIPWDDDMDVCMPRKDFDWLRDNIPSEFNKYDIDVKYEDGRIGIGYQHVKTGIWLDVFAADEICTDKAINDCYPRMRKYQNTIVGKIAKLSSEEQESIRSKYLERNGGNKYIVDCLDFFKQIYTFSYNDVFPLTTMKFEGYQFCVPNNCDVVLRKFYGSSYMSLPKSGVNHHGTVTDRAPLSTWAKSHNIDMHEVKRHLDGIYQEMSDEK